MMNEQMNDNYLIQGECLEEMAKLPDGFIDAVICDSPYGTTACKWDAVIPFEPMWEQLKRIVKPNGAIVLTAAQPFTSALVMSNPKMFKYDWIWEKPNGTGHLNAKKQPMRNKEDVLVFYKKQCSYFPRMTEGDPYRWDSVRSGGSQYGKVGNEGIENKGLRFPKQCLKFPQERGLHPTQKPVALMEYLIKTYTNEGEVVLDFAMGSGTTGVACAHTEREFIGIEQDPEYFAIAEDRLSSYRDRCMAVRKRVRRLPR